MSFTAGAGTRFVVTSTTDPSGGITPPSPILGPLTFTAGTATTNTPAFDITQTWNNAAITFTGLRFNVTDTASNAASLLMDLQVGGVSRFNVSKTGRVFATDISMGSNTGTLSVNNSIQFFYSGVFVASFGAALGSAGVLLSSTVPLGWNNSSTTSGTADLFIFRDAANTLAQRNGVNAQTFNIYNTFTDASNYERGGLRWQSNELQLRVDGLGTGQNRAFQIVVGGQIVAYFNSAGNRSVALGAGEIATNATSGFVYVPTCAGVPTGIPEAYTGRAPIVVDTTNNKLYFYSGGAWRDAGP